MRFYCSADGQGPRDIPPWTALYVEAGEEDAATVDAIREAEQGHLARSGWGPRTRELHPGAVLLFLANVVLEGEADSFGGRIALVRGVGVLGVDRLLCPECLAPVRAVPDPAY